MKIWMPASVVALFFGLLACNPPAEKIESAPVVTIAQPVDSPITTQDSPVATMPDTIAKAALLGKIDPAHDTNFVAIAQKYTSKSGIYLRREAYSAFEKMWTAATSEGIKLVIISATRPFAAQKGIWEAKWNGATLVGGKNLSTAVPDPVERAKTILRYSSMPTTSRHHWGTDIDLNNLESAFWEGTSGKKIHDWLAAHASEYGFCQPYTAIGPERPNGYQEEKWHWSYMPISAKFLKAYQRQVTLADIVGFKGAEAAQPLNVIEHYVSGIGGVCLDWQ